MHATSTWIEHAASRQGDFLSHLEQCESARMGKREVPGARLGQAVLGGVRCWEEPDVSSHAMRGSEAAQLEQVLLADSAAHIWPQLGGSCSSPRAAGLRPAATVARM